MGPRSSGLVAIPLYLLSQLNGTHHNERGEEGGREREGKEGKKEGKKRKRKR